ncbi:MAG: hypothetical protein Ct9H300mP20_20610 [Gammaproteobacteria bacterium]|nr:MAG: hypothetical protein Ct9H300mP20_20610 [Gammaproteobacteria bacterium]
MIQRELTEIRTGEYKEGDGDAWGIAANMECHLLHLVLLTFR